MSIKLTDELLVSNLQKIVEMREPGEQVGSILTCVDAVDANYFRALDSNKLVEWIDLNFKQNPPVYGRDTTREILFTALELALCLIEKKTSGTSYYPGLWTHNIRRLEALHEEIVRRGKPDRGVIVYKLYNAGFILVAKDTILGIDCLIDFSTLDPEHKRHFSSAHLVPGYADLLDGVLVTHNHSDHWDKTLEAELQKRGKLFHLVTYDTAAPFGALTDSGEIARAPFAAFKGGHRDVTQTLSGYVRVDIGEQKILHSGDNAFWTAKTPDNDQYIDWTDTDYAQNIDAFLIKPQVVFIEDWLQTGVKPHSLSAMEKVLHALRPKMLIPHHLMEYGHRIWALSHSLGFALEELRHKETRLQMLHWGESVILS